MKTKQSFLMTLVLVLLNGTLPGQAAITHYVSVNSTTPLAPYTSWGTAATVIQDAIDVASDSDTILVTNGTYAAGGRAVFGVMTNRVAVDRAVLLKSVNGPAVTVIQGSQTRCVYLELVPKVVFQESSLRSVQGFCLNGIDRIFCIGIQPIWDHQTKRSSSKLNAAPFRYRALASFPRGGLFRGAQAA